MGEILDPAGLAAKLGLSAETVRQYSTKRPGSLPPRVTWSKRPRWDSDVVEGWLRERAGAKETPIPTGEPRNRVGRPRKRK